MKLTGRHLVHHSSSEGQGKCAVKQRGVEWSLGRSQGPIDTICKMVVPLHRRTQAQFAASEHAHRCTHTQASRKTEIGTFMVHSYEPAFERLGQEGHYEFEASLGYIGNPYFSHKG